MNAMADELIEGAPVCPRCLGQHLTPWQKPSCKAHRSQRDDEGRLVPCRGPTRPGMVVCKSHGGLVPKVVAKAKRTVALAAEREDLKRVARLFGVPRQIDPAQGLIEEYWRCAGIVSRLEDLVSALPIDQVTFGVVSEATKTTKIDGLIGVDGEVTEAREVERKVTRAPRPHALVRMFNEERDRFAKLGTEIVRLNLEARRDEYVQHQVGVFAAVIERLALSDDQRRTLARLLREVDARTKTIEGGTAR